MSFGIDHQVGSVVVFASLVLTFITQAALMDIYLIYYLHPVALWILLVGDTAVLGHLVWSAYPSQTADHAAVSWVIYSICIAGKCVVMNIAIVPILNAPVPYSSMFDETENQIFGGDGEAISVSLSVAYLIIPLFYLLVMWTASRQLFAGSSGKITVDSMIHCDMLWHVVLDIIDILYMMRFVRPQDIRGLSNAFFKCSTETQNDCLSQFALFQNAGIAMTFIALLFHSQSFPGVEYVKPVWARIPDTRMRRLRHIAKMNRDKSSFGIESLYKEGQGPSSIKESSLAIEMSPKSKPFGRSGSDDSNQGDSFKARTLRRRSAPNATSSSSPQSSVAFGLPIASGSRSPKDTQAKQKRGNSVSFDDDLDGDDDGTPIQSESEKTDERSSTSGRSSKYRRGDSLESSNDMNVAPMISVVHPDADGPDLSPSNSPGQRMFSIGAEDDDGMENPSEVATVMGSRGGSVAMPHLEDETVEEEATHFGLSPGDTVRIMRKVPISQGCQVKILVGEYKGETGDVLKITQRDRETFGFARMFRTSAGRVLVAVHTRTMAPIIFKEAELEVDYQREFSDHALLPSETGIIDRDQHEKWAAIIDGNIHVHVYPIMGRGRQEIDPNRSACWYRIPNVAVLSIANPKAQSPASRSRLSRRDSDRSTLVNTTNKQPTGRFLQVGGTRSRSSASPDRCSDPSSKSSKRAFSGVSNSTSGKKSIVGPASTHLDSDAERIQGEQDDLVCDMGDLFVQGRVSTGYVPTRTVDAAKADKNKPRVAFLVGGHRLNVTGRFAGRTGSKDGHFDSVPKREPSDQIMMRESRLDAGIPLSEFPDGRMQLAITPLDADEGYFTPSDEEIDQMLALDKEMDELNAEEDLDELRLPECIAPADNPLDEDPVFNPMENSMADEHAASKFRAPVSLGLRRSWQVMVARKRSAMVSLFCVDIPFFTLRSYLVWITWSIGMPYLSPFLIKNLVCAVLQGMQLRVVLHGEQDMKKKLMVLNQYLLSVYSEIAEFHGLDKFPKSKWYHWWRWLKDWWFDDFAHVRQASKPIENNRYSKISIWWQRFQSAFWMHFMMLVLGFTLGFIVTRHSWLSIDARSAAQMCPMCYQDKNGSMGSLDSGRRLTDLVDFSDLVSAVYDQLRTAILD